MTQATLKDLKFNSRGEALGFLKELWNEQKVNCPICGNELEILHKKAKKDNADWQCKCCDKTFKTMILLKEINEEMPD